MSADPAEHQKEILRDEISSQVRQEALNRQTPSALSQLKIGVEVHKINTWKTATNPI